MTGKLKILLIMYAKPNRDNVSYTVKSDNKDIIRVNVNAKVCEFLFISYNGLGLLVRAGFEAQSFIILSKFNRSTKFQVCKFARQPV